MKKIQHMITTSLMMICLLGSLVACGGDAADPAPANAPTLVLYGTTHGASELVELDPTDGSLLRTIGPVGYRVNGLTFDPTDGRLYATTSTGDPVAPDSLIEIDLTTGTGTLIGASGGKINVPTIDSTGALFAWTDDAIDALLSVDKTNAASAMIGDCGLFTAEQGLAFDNNDTLYLVNNDLFGGGGDVHTIDTTTGDATYLGDLGQMAHHGDFHPVTNLYWGIDTTAYYGTSARNLLVVDTATISIDDTLPTVDNLHTISFGLL